MYIVRYQDLTSNIFMHTAYIPYLYISYSVNVERGNSADKLQPRNINVSFQKNSHLGMDAMIFTSVPHELVKDVETGIVSKFFKKHNIVRIK